MRYLRAVTNRGILDLNEIADFDFFPKHRAGTQIGEWPNGCPCADGCLAQHRMLHCSPIHNRAVFDFTGRPDNAILSDYGLAFKQR
ncbi:hypothetical protein D3C81_1657600 [compost metagenome]